jgi:hypothetical protein
MNKQFFKIQQKSFNHEKFGDRKDVKDLVDLVLIVLAFFYKGRLIPMLIQFFGKESSD